MKPIAPNDVPDWKLERLALGELPEPDQSALQSLLANDPALRARLDALIADTQSTLDQYPPELIARRIRQRQNPNAARPMRRAVLFGGPLLVAASVALFVMPHQQGSFGDHVSEETRTKGLRPGLFVYKKSSDGSMVLSDGAQAKTADVLQLSYVAAGHRYGVVLSLDGRGTVTQHFPASGSRDTALAQAGEVALPQAYELDNAPRFERFFLVTSKVPIDVEHVLDSARKLGARSDADRSPLELETALEQTSILLKKVP